MTGKQSAVFFAFVILGMGCFYYLMIEPGRRAERLRQAIRQGTSVEHVESLLTGRYSSYYRVKTADGWEGLSRSELPTKTIRSQMNHTASLFTAIIAAVTASGCTVDLHPTPSNANPDESNAVAVLKPVAENLSWDSDGNVRTVDLGGDHITNQHLKHVVQFTKIEELNLIGTRITDDGLQELGRLTHLRALGLAWTGVTNDGMQHLQNLPRLRLIDLNHTAISDSGLQHLARICTLERVFATRTEVSDSGIDEFLRQLPECKVQR